MKPKALFPSLFGWLILLSALFFASSCGTDDPERQAAKDREKIIEYLIRNNLQATELPSGVFYVIQQTGHGPFPTESSTVIVTYTGTLLNGNQFDHGVQREFFLPNSIPGFRQGVPKFNRGARGIILIPSGMAYGRSGTHTIPPNSVLIFNIEMFDWR